MTLSVSNSTSGSSTATGSPTAFIHFATVASVAELAKRRHSDFGCHVFARSTLRQGLNELPGGMVAEERRGRGSVPVRPAVAAPLREP